MNGLIIIDTLAMNAQIVINNGCSFCASSSSQPGLGFVGEKSESRLGQRRAPLALTFVFLNLWIVRVMENVNEQLLVPIVSFVSQQWSQSSLSPLSVGVMKRKNRRTLDIQRSKSDGKDTIRFIPLIGNCFCSPLHSLLRTSQRDESLKSLLDAAWQCLVSGDQVQVTKQTFLSRKRRRWEIRETRMMCGTDRLFVVSFDWKDLFLVLSNEHSLCEVDYQQSTTLLEMSFYLVQIENALMCVPLWRALCRFFKGFSDNGDRPELGIDVVGDSFKTVFSSSINRSHYSGHILIDLVCSSRERTAN